MFVPRNCTVEDLEVDLTAKHLMVKVAGWGVFRRHWAYTCRSDEASWHLVDDCVEINQLVRLQQTQSLERRRVDGVGRPKFDFHTG